MSIISERKMTDDEIFKIFFPFHRKNKEEEIVEITIRGSKYRMFEFDTSENGNLKTLPEKNIFKIQYGWRNKTPKPDGSKQMYNHFTVPESFCTDLSISELVEKIKKEFGFENFFSIISPDSEAALIVNCEHLEKHKWAYLLDFRYDAPDCAYFLCDSDGLCFHIPVFLNQENFLDNYPEFLQNIFFDCCNNLEYIIRKNQEKLESCLKNLGSETRLIYETRGNCVDE